MPISIKNDVKPAFGFGSSFSLGRTPVYTPLAGSGQTIYFGDIGGSYLNSVRPVIAKQNWNEFHSDTNFSLPDFQRDVARSISLKFDLDPSRTRAFDDLWTFVQNAREYEDKKKLDGTLEQELEDAYHSVALLAAGENSTKATFSRVLDTSEEKLVVFSDFHMTAFSSSSVPDYYFEFNHALYLEVLDHYAGQDYCVVENGDVEDCLLYVPDSSEAEARAKAAPKAFGIGELAFPITLDDSAWDDFMQLRYARREANQQAIFDKFRDYYDKVRSKFVARSKNGELRYVRLTGNHDTYLNQERERLLRDRVQAKLGVDVVDVLRVKRNGRIDYVVTHGHQFDESCMQHGAIPFAQSLGEVYSECLAWCNQGADRVWREDDTKRWYVGTTFGNALAWADPMRYPYDAKADLLLGNLEKIKAHGKSFIETLVKKQVAWEYFENSDGFEAFALEVWTGDEMYKLRHLDEVKLCKRYEAKFEALRTGKPIPTLVLGHTHEPRQNATYQEGASNHVVDFYLNSGAAGRFENLIWCVEIEGNVDRIVSWSKVDGQLTKVTWKSNKGMLEHDTKVVVGGAG